MASPARNTSEESQPATSSCAQLAETNAAMDPTDRSICPAVITKVMATPTISAGATCVARLDRFAGVRKLSLASVKKTKTTRVTPAMTRVALLVRSHHEIGWASRATEGAGLPVVGAVV